VKSRCYNSYLLIVRIVDLNYKVRLMSKLSIASWGLALGSLGQLGLLGRFMSHGGWAFRVIPVFVFLPWLTVYAISFCKQPPFGPRPFRYCLIFAMSWYAFITLVAETLSTLAQPVVLGGFPITAARALTYLGAISFVVLIQACVAIRRYEDSQA
jgi:hypothetical protein